MEYRIAVAQQLRGLLRSIRKDRRLTQQQLGERLGLSQRMVAKLEAYPEKASFERVFVALSALDTDLIVKDRKAAATSQHPNDIPNSPESGKW